MVTLLLVAIFHSRVRQSRDSAYEGTLQATQTLSAMIAYADLHVCIAFPLCVGRFLS